MKYKMIILLLFWPLLSSAENFYKVRLYSVYDGDTFKVSLACRYPLFCKKISVRVNGIDCPELRTKDICEKQTAQKAKEFNRKAPSSCVIVRRISISVCFVMFLYVSQQKIPLKNRNKTLPRPF